MCDRNDMFGDKSTFGSSYNGQFMPIKGQQVFCCCFTFNQGQLPTF